MNAVVWEPLRRLEEIDKVIDGWLGQPASRSGETARTWRPAADYRADADGYLVRVDLPGVRKEDVDINVENDVLSVRASRKALAEASEDQAKSSQTFLDEIRTGTFSRAFKLARDADASAVSASMSDGVLEVRVPKRKEAQARKIEIKS